MSPKVLILLVFAGLQAQAKMTITERYDRQRARVEAGVAEGSIRPVNGAATTARIDYRQQQFNNAVAEGTMTPEKRSAYRYNLNQRSTRINYRRHN